MECAVRKAYYRRHQLDGAKMIEIFQAVKTGHDALWLRRISAKKQDAGGLKPAGILKGEDTLKWKNLFLDDFDFNRLRTFGGSFNIQGDTV